MGAQGWWWCGVGGGGRCAHTPLIPPLCSLAMTSQVKAWEQSPVARMGLLGAVTLREQDEHQLGGHRIPASLPACFLPLWVRSRP